MPRSRPSVALMIAALLAVAAAVWAVSIRTRPTFAVYDSVPGPPPAPAGSAGAALAPTAPDTASAAPLTPAPARHIAPARSVPTAARTARADTGADSTAAPDTVRHHRSDNYGGYSGYGSKERRGTPNAR